MRNSYSTKGIRDIIVANAHNIAQSIVIKLKLPSYHFEDLVQQLLIAGIAFEKEYRKGASSLNTYLTKRMRDFGQNIQRDAQTQKRRVNLFTCELEMEKPDSPSLQMVVSPDYISIIEIRSLMPTLNVEEKRFMDALLDANLNEARNSLGWSRSKFDRVREQIKKKLEK